MALSFASLVDGNPIQANDLNSRLKTAQDYSNVGIIAGDLSTSQWVNTEHVMPGRYHSVSNTMSFVSGFSGGRVKSVPYDLYTYLNRGNTKRVNAAFNNNDQWSFLPNSAVTLSLPRTPSMIFISWFGYHIHTTYSDGRDGGADIELVLTKDVLGSDNSYQNGGYTAGTSTTSGRYKPSISWSIEEDRTAFDSSLPTSPNAGKILRAPNAGFLMVDTSLSPGVWRAALVGKTNSPKVKWLQWTLSVEAWV